jgi:hypothetical protein
VNYIEKLIHTYASVYITLVRWAEGFVGRADAHKFVAASMADCFRWACTAWDSNEGPYAAIVDAVLSRMVHRGYVDPLKAAVWPLSNVGVPGEAENCEIARLYAAVYHCCVTSGWSLREREDIYLWLRTRRLPDVELSQGAVVEVEYPLAPDPLRRALELMNDHACGEELVCPVAQDLWEHEERKGANWSNTFPRKGASTN